MDTKKEMSRVQNLIIAIKAKKINIFLLGLFLLYGITRIYNLGILPLFVDESIYIRWATLISHGQYLFLPLIDGKLLQVWLSSLVVGITNPLWVCRFILVLSGAFTMWTTYQIGKLLQNQYVGLFAAYFYIIVPFTLFYDRMALPDGMLTTFTALSLLWSINLIREARWKYVILLGVSMAFAIITKVPGLLVLFTPLLTGFLLHASKNFWKLVKWAYSITVIIALYPVVAFFTTTTQIKEKSVLGSSLIELLKHFIVNIQIAFEWLLSYWTLPVMILGILGLIVSLLRKRYEGILLFLVALIPIVVFALISNVWFPRYILFTSVPFFVLASLGLFELFKSKISTVLLIITVIVSGCFAWLLDYYLWINPIKTPLPPIERFQYVEGCPSGYGVKQMVAYIHQKMFKYPGKIIVVCPDPSYTYSLLAGYLINYPQIKVLKMSLNSSQAFSKLENWAEKYLTFVVSEYPAVNRAKGWKSRWLSNTGKLLSMANMINYYSKPGGKCFIDSKPDDKCFIELYRVRNNVENSRRKNLNKN